MKVFQYLAPHAVGGIETMVRSLTLGLRQRGIDVRVGAMVPAGADGMDWVSALRMDGIDVDVMPPVGVLHDSRALAGRVGAWKPAILHTHGYRADILAALTPRRPPTIATVHGYTPTDWRLRAYTRLDQLALRRFDRVVAVSAVIRDTLVQRGVRADRVQVEHNGIDVPDAPEGRASLRGALSLAPDRFVIGCVGRLSEEKAHVDLLRAVARLDAPEVVVLIVGDGPCRQGLEDLVVELGLGGRVRFLGFRNDIERLYPAMDLFALPSHTEGSPAVLLEAFAYRVPVVATRVGAVPHMLAEGTEGLLVEPGDIDGLARAIDLLRTGPARRDSLAAAANARYEREFRRARWLDRVVAAYESLLGQRTKR